MPSDSRPHQRGPARLAADMTPMVDVVFLLIIFFVLVSQIAGGERIDMTLPDVEQNTAQPPKTDRLILNVAPPEHARTTGAAYRLGPRGYADTPRGMTALTQAIRDELERNPSTSILVRAPRDASYATVHPALRACAEAGVRDIHLMTAPEPTSAQRQ
ncbi:MAG: biopolymer transporter ExbD [Planctomycetota bacterium]|nr:biopolymer transporter ExbD [Planctomycetota bacterium]